MLQTLGQGITPAVLPHVVGLENEHENNSHRDGSDDGDLSGDIVGLVVRAEGQRAEDIAQTKGHQHDSVHGDLLRVAGDISTGNGVHDGQGGANAVGEVVAGELGGLALGKGHETGAEQAERQHGDQTETALVEAAGGVGGGEDAEEADDAAGDGQQLGLGGGEAEALDEEGGEAADGAVGHVHRRHDHCDQVRLRVAERLRELRELELLVLDACAVGPQPLHRDQLLAVAQPRLHRVVGEEDHHGDAHRDC